MQVRPPAALHTAPTGYARAGKACFERSLPLERRVRTRARRLRGCQTVKRLGYANEGQVVAAQATATERAISAGTTARVPVVELPVETAQAFKKQLESLQEGLDWFHDSTLFSQTARAVLDNTCSERLLQQLSEMTTSINAPSALLLSGLPLEDVVPPTLGDLPISKVFPTA